MLSIQRVAEAQREDLTDEEQLALAAWANELEVFHAIQSNGTFCSEAEYIARAARNSVRPWWQRPFYFYRGSR
jgi:hypothetical protein